MKHLLFGITTLGVAAFLAGCPIYSDNGNYRVCNSNGCFDCPDNSQSEACLPWPCESNADCGSSSICQAGTCGPGGGYSGSSGTSGVSGSSGASGVSGATGTSGTSGTTSMLVCSSLAGCPDLSTCGHDGLCHPGDCGGDVGCISPYVCKLVAGHAQCIASPAEDASVAFDGAVTDGGSGTDATSATDALISIDATSLLDASAPLDAMMSFVDAPFADAAPPPGAACNADSDCGDAGTNARCIDGQCASQSELCSDGTQCVVSGDSCVDGTCTPPCSASAPCAAGFACDFTRHVCSENPDGCATTTDCQGGTVCVEGHCAAPCGTGDAAPACPGGQVCVNSGCIPDQRAAFTCFNDGVEGPLANHCDTADICLHHDCYVACDLGSDAGSCPGNTACKDVTVAAGTFAVCGTSTNLGSQCDLAAGRTCPVGADCVDGYCE